MKKLASLALLLATAAIPVAAQPNAGAFTLHIEPHGLTWNNLPNGDARVEFAIAVCETDDHGNIVSYAVKELATTPEGGSYAKALRELFDLDRNAVEAVTRADLAADALLDADLGGLPPTAGLELL